VKGAAFEESKENLEIMASMEQQKNKHLLHAIQ